MPNEYKWNRQLDIASIENRRAEARVRRGWKIFWFALSFLGAVSFAYLIWRHNGDYSELKNALMSRGFEQILFWLGLMATMFLTKDYFDMDTSRLRLVEILSNTKKIVQINEHFSPNSLRVLDDAHVKFFKSRKGGEWLPFFILESVLSSEQGRLIAMRLGADPKSMKEKISKMVTQAQLQPAPQANYVTNLVFRSFEHAVKNNKHYVNIDDVFWAIGTLPSEARDFLTDHGIDEKGLVGMSQWLHISRELNFKRSHDRGFRLERTKHWRNQLWTSTVTPLLDSVGRDLTAEAASYYPMVGREEELDKIYELVETGTLGLLLLGNKGAGVSKLIEGLAQKIVTQEVPPGLADRRVHTLSLGKILSLSGAQAPIKALAQQLTKEIQRSGNIILILEDLPSLEAVKTEEATIIIEQLLMDALNNRNLILLATADPKSLTQSSGGLMNTLQVVEVKPMDDAGTLNVLETMAPYLEVEYKLNLTFNALRQVVALSKYQHDLAQPGQAVQTLRRICEDVAMRQKNAPASPGASRGGWVTSEIVDQQIAAMTQLPLGQVSQRETDVLMNLEDLIYKKYVNQKDAVTAVAASLRRARTQLKDEVRPIGSFLFLGPTGVGKTELARRLAEIYFKSKSRMIRLDMSEYQETQSLRNLIGAPPGTGSTEEGSLVKAIKENPFSVILLDELEKAHPDILNIFLQVMEDGRLTSSMGETYDFSHTIIIGTSNAGAIYIQKALESGLTMEEIDESLKKRELLQSFKPEFLNRFDAIVVFKPLSFDNVLIIARILLKGLEDQLATQGILLQVEKDAIQDLAKEGFNPAQGARPLRRVIQDKIEDQIAKLILDKKVKQRDTLVLKKDFQIEIKEALHY